MSFVARAAIRSYSMKSLINPMKIGTLSRSLSHMSNFPLKIVDNKRHHFGCACGACGSRLAHTDGLSFLIDFNLFSITTFQYEIVLIKILTSFDNT